MPMTTVIPSIGCGCKRHWGNDDPMADTSEPAPVLTASYVIDTASNIIIALNMICSQCGTRKEIKALQFETIKAVEGVDGKGKIDASEIRGVPETMKTSPDIAFRPLPVEGGEVLSEGQVDDEGRSAISLDADGNVTGPVYRNQAGEEIGPDDEVPGPIPPEVFRPRTDAEQSDGPIGHDDAPPDEEEDDEEYEGQHEIRKITDGVEKRGEDR